MSREPTLGEIQDLLLRIEGDLKEDLREIRGNLDTKVSKELHDEQVRSLRKDVGTLADGIDELKADRKKSEDSLRNVWRTSLGSFATQLVLALVLFVMLRSGGPV